MGNKTMTYRDRIISQIKEEIKKERISQKDLAKKLGILEPNLSRIINGQRNISLNTAVKLADYFNKSLDELIGRRVEQQALPVILGHPRVTTGVSNGACFCPKCEFTFYRQSIGYNTWLFGKSYKQYCSNCGTLLSVPYK